MPQTDLIATWGSFMQSFIEHARTLEQRIARNTHQRAQFGQLAAGQSPTALFVTCSDSRVIPSSESATIEYAVDVLEVPDIIVCGHSHCGAVGARVRGEDLTTVPAVASWLNTQLPDGLDALGHDEDPGVHVAVQRNVRVQLERLRTHPCVHKRLAEGRLRLHG